MNIRYIEEELRALSGENIEKLKKLPVEEQMECFFVRTVERMSTSFTTDTLESTDRRKLLTYTKISDWIAKEEFCVFDEILVTDGVFAGIKSRNGEILSLSSHLRRRVIVDDIVWDSHTHEIYPIKKKINTYVELVLYTKHEKMMI